MIKPPELRQIPPRRVWFEAACSNTETCGHRHTVYFSALRCAQEHGGVGVVANLDGLRLDLFEIYTAETDTQTVIWRIVKMLQNLQKQWDDEQGKKLEALEKSRKSPRIQQAQLNG